MDQPRKFRCLDCGAEFDSREELDRHQRHEHREQRKEPSPEAPRPV